MFELPKAEHAPFRDREDAGRQIVENYPLDFEPDLILAIPRGGLPVAYEISKGLKCSMDVLATRKLQIPGNPEAGFGAVSFDGSSVINEEIVQQEQITAEQIRDEIDRSERYAKQLMWVYRQGLPQLQLGNKKIIITDDGLATGYTMLAAIITARRLKADSISILVPCAHQNAVQFVGRQADNIFALHQSAGPSFAVADFYQFWWDLTDQEGAKYLSKASNEKSV